MLPQVSNIAKESSTPQIKTRIKDFVHTAFFSTQTMHAIPFRIQQLSNKEKIEFIYITAIIRASSPLLSKKEFHNCRELKEIGNMYPTSYTKNRNENADSIAISLKIMIEFIILRISPQTHNIVNFIALSFQGHLLVHSKLIFSQQNILILYSRFTCLIPS